MIIYRGYTDRGTFGRWYTDEGEFICYSMEREWNNNEPYVSCVPEGDYGLSEYSSEKYPETYALVNHDLGVGIQPGAAHRSLILIHAANTPDQLAGCIAPGKSYASFGAQWGVASSRNALKDIMEIAAKETILSIRSVEARWTPISV